MLGSKITGIGDESHVWYWIGPISSGGSQCDTLGCIPKRRRCQWPMITTDETKYVTTIVKGREELITEEKEEVTELLC